MSSRPIPRKCADKVRHATAEAAFGALRSMLRGNRVEPGRLAAYRCDLCGGFHISARKTRHTHPA